MFKTNKLSYLTAILLFLSCTTIKAEANSLVSSDNISTEIQFIPPQDGEEPETKGAGTRNPQGQKCAANEAEIKAIMPENNYGLTNQERPKIFLYLSETKAKQVVLSFQDRSREYHEVAFLPIQPNPLNSNIISFALPEEKPPLETGKYYQWKLTIVCGDLPHVNDPILTGWVKRINVDETITQLKQKSAIKQAQWYGINGYWYDLLEQLEAAEKANSQDNLDSDIWQSLMEQY